MRPMRTGRFHAALVAALGALVLLAHVLGATVPRRALWGANLYAFLPPWTLPVALVVTGSALAWLARIASRVARAHAVAGGQEPPSAPRGWVVIAVGVASLVIFWLLRIRHTLLGD